MRSLILSDLPLPPGVSIHHGSYILRKRGQRKKTLSRVSAGESALHEALRQLPLIEIPTPRTMHELFEEYKKSANGLELGMAKLKPSTRKQYVDMIDRFLDPGFGQMRLGALTAGNVTKYLSYRREGYIVAPYKKNPKKGVVAAANRERAVLSAVLTYAEGFDWLPGNVVKMTKKIKETSRDPLGQRVKR